MIIAISGKKQSGKDTVGNIIQYLLSSRTYDKSFIEWENLLKEKPNHGRWYAGYCTFKIKKFADTLKDIVCLLLNCTREDLENEHFKNKELSKDWWVHYIIPEVGYGKKLISYTGDEKEKHLEIIKLTPRKLLQILGTECGRNIIHPNIWINSLFNQYKLTFTNNNGNQLPNWVITDMRFPNELKSVKDRKGITIRINRTVSNRYKGSFYVSPVREHISETALDNAKFDYYIDNNNDLNYLVEQVKQILIKENLYNV